MDEEDRVIKDAHAEAAVVASVLLKPELIFYSENLKPNHFTVEENAWLYWAVSDLVNRGYETVDVYSVINNLYRKESTRQKVEDLITVPMLKETFEEAGAIARDDHVGYLDEVGKVLDAALRREICKMADEFKRVAGNTEIDDIENRAYQIMDQTMMKFSLVNEIPEVKDLADSVLEQIEEEQNGKSGLPFKWPTLNDYVRIEPGELVIFGAQAKQGKSMLLLNEAVDLMRQGKSVLYLDSELNSKMFITRLYSHLSGIEYGKLKTGNYSEEEHLNLLEARDWLKSKTLTHLYMPIFDESTVYTTTKRLKHLGKLDVLIIDYFKSSKDEAYANYAELGRFVDLVKNKLAGALNIPALGAAQATSTGRLADSAKIGRNASTIIMLDDKTPEEIEADGPECGNKKLRIILNRNGAQMGEGEYIDMQFNGNLISYEEAKQHQPVVPY